MVMLFLAAIIITVHKNIHRLIPYTPGGYKYVETGKKTEYTPPYRDIGRITLCSRGFLKRKKGRARENEGRHRFFM